MTFRRNTPIKINTTKKIEQSKSSRAQTLSKSSSSQDKSDDELESMRTLNQTFSFEYDDYDGVK